MATVPHVISGLGLRKLQADGFLLTRVYVRLLSLSSSPKVYTIKCELRQIIFVFREWIDRELNENCALLPYYAASNGNFLPTFRDNLWPPSSGDSWPLKMGLIGCPETSVRNYHYSLRNNPEEEVLIYFSATAWNHTENWMNSCLLTSLHFLCQLSGFSNMHFK